MNRRNATCQILPSLANNLKARVSNHVPECLLIRKFLNALHQILVAIPISGHQLPDEWNRAKRPPLVYPVQSRRAGCHLAELEAGKDTTGPQDAVGGPQRGG